MLRFSGIVSAKNNRLTCVMLISLFIYDIIQRSSNETKSRESYIPN